MVATHFNGVCKTLHVTIKHLEVFKTIKRNTPSNDILTQLKSIQYIPITLQHEHLWAEKVHTQGLNKKLNSHHLFISKSVSDKTSKIVQITPDK